MRGTLTTATRVAFPAVAAGVVVQVFIVLDTVQIMLPTSDAGALAALALAVLGYPLWLSRDASPAVPSAPSQR